MYRKSVGRILKRIIFSWILQRDAVRFCKWRRWLATTTVRNPSGKLYDRRRTVRSTPSALAPFASLFLHSTLLLFFVLSVTCSNLHFSAREPGCSFHRCHASTSRQRPVWDDFIAVLDKYTGKIWKFFRELPALQTAMRRTILLSMICRRYEAKEFLFYQECKVLWQMVTKILSAWNV